LVGPHRLHRVVKITRVRNRSVNDISTIFWFESQANDKQCEFMPWYRKNMLFLKLKRTGNHSNVSLPNNNGSDLSARYARKSHITSLNQLSSFIYSIYYIPFIRFSHFYFYLITKCHSVFIHSRKITYKILKASTSNICCTVMW